MKIKMLTEAEERKTQNDVNEVERWMFNIFPYDMDNDRIEITSQKYDLADIPYEVRKELCRQILQYPNNTIRKIYNQEVVDRHKHEMDDMEDDFDSSDYEHDDDYHDYESEIDDMEPIEPRTQVRIK